MRKSYILKAKGNIQGSGTLFFELFGVVNIQPGQSKQWVWRSILYFIFLEIRRISWLLKFAVIHIKFDVNA